MSLRRSMSLVLVIAVALIAVFATPMQSPLAFPRTTPTDPSRLLASDPSTMVNMRIEARNRTIFEGSIFSRAHYVTSASGVTILCDGTNANANPTPWLTCTSVLDHVARLDYFSWDGTYFAEMDDFFITRIAESEQTETQFWGLFVNLDLVSVGGCQRQVYTGDAILWAFDAFNKNHFLDLYGPWLVRAGEPEVFRVVDGMSSQPIANATVRSMTTGETVGATDAHGEVQLTFDATVLFHALKAERADSVRSNRLDVTIMKPLPSDGLLL